MRSGALYLLSRKVLSFKFLDVAKNKPMRPTDGFSRKRMVICTRGQLGADAMLSSLVCLRQTYGGAQVESLKCSSIAFPGAHSSE